jgi:hypothetical protein
MLRSAALVLTAVLSAAFLAAAAAGYVADTGS